MKNIHKLSNKEIAIITGGGNNTTNTQLHLENKNQTHSNGNGTSIITQTITGLSIGAGFIIFSCIAGTLNFLCVSYAALRKRDDD